MKEKLFKNIVRAVVACILVVAAYVFWTRLDGKMEEAKSGGAQFITSSGIDPVWLASKAKEQIEEIQSTKVFHEFKFENSLVESGITFKHKINPDCGKTYKPVHYDHGNGVAVADVDNDGVLDAYFVSQVGPGELWRGLDGGVFEDMTKISGLEITGDKSCIGASFADIDNDGDPDLYITTLREGNFLFENDGRGIFTDISKEAGVDYHGHSSGTVFFDYNLDGLLDIFVANVGIYTTDQKEDFQIDSTTYSYFVGLKDGFAGHLKEERFEGSVLYKNLGGNRFENVTATSGISELGWTGDAAILDGNDDGYPDLYVTNMQGNDFYYENQGGITFEEKRESLFPKTPWGAMGISVFDFDNDGNQDVYITDMHSDMLGGDLDPNDAKKKQKADVKMPSDYLLTNGMSLFGNALFKKGQANDYKEISDEINAESYWPWGLSSGDLNADGYEDVFITASMNYPYRFSPNGVLLNEGGKRFLDSEFVLGIEPREKFSQPWFTLDCSGVDQGHIHCQDREGELAVWGATGSRSSVLFDLDNDGDLDVITNEFNDVPQVLISNLSEREEGINYLKIKLKGEKSNRDGIGAKVMVKVGEQTYTKIMTGKSGYMSQSSFPLYFGLNSSSSVDEINIHWPSGIRQKLTNPEINGLLIIEEQSVEK